VDNSKALYFFPFYVKDWLSSRSVKRMTLAQKGAYIELLATQWLDGSLPDDQEELRAILGASQPEFSKVWKRVEPMFPVCSDGQRRNEKLDDLREKALEKSQKASASVSKRWAKSERVEPENDTNVLRTHYDRNTNDIPYKNIVISNQESVKESEDSLGDEPPQTPKKPTPRFVPPTVQEVEGYMTEQNWPTPTATAQKFHDYWTSAGWRRKAGPVKDWKATVRTWLANEAERAQPQKKSQSQGALDMERRAFERFGRMGK